MRDGLFISFLTAMSVVTLTPRARPPLRPSSEWTVQTSWLAQRESAIGDWDAVRPPLREGDELQLTVLSSEAANIYVLDEDGHRIFPGAPPQRVSVRAGWPYAVPGPHLTWRLDGSAHDVLYLVAARHPLDDPAAALKGGASPAQSAPDLELPLRDGKPGSAPARLLHGDGVLVDVYRAR